MDAVSWLEMRTYMANTLLRDSDVMGNGIRDVGVWHPVAVAR